MLGLLLYIIGIFIGGIAFAFFIIHIGEIFNQKTVEKIEALGKISSKPISDFDYSLSRKNLTFSTDLYRGVKVIYQDKAWILSGFLYENIPNNNSDLYFTTVELSYNINLTAACFKNTDLSKPLICSYVYEH